MLTQVPKAQGHPIRNRRYVSNGVNGRQRDRVAKGLLKRNFLIVQGGFGKIIGIVRGKVCFFAVKRACQLEVRFLGGSTMKKISLNLKKLC